MFVFVSGAVRSGKSSWAEERAISLYRASGSPRGSLVYLATARVRDREMRDRVLRHRETRGGKGFKTLERDVDISGITDRLPARPTVLLECLGTLLANEMFERETNRDEIYDEGKIHSEILLLKARAVNLLVVSNDIFSDGATHGEETENYRRILGALHVKLAREADLAVECVFGRPFVHKQMCVIHFP